MNTAHHEYTGIKTLEHLSGARNYNHFLEEELTRFIAPTTLALDFGAGIGEFAKRLTHRALRVDCIEADPDLCAMLRSDGLSCTLTLDAPGMQYERIYSLNVLEHIEDDRAALRQLHGRLADDGKLFLFVPAYMCLYSEFDRFIGHYRRYEIPDLREKLVASGFAISRIEYVDSLGFFAWWLLKWLPGGKTAIHPAKIWLFDRCVFPVSRIADRVLCRLLGKNILCIARKL